jgi:hypothetical protein
MQLTDKETELLKKIKRIFILKTVLINVGTIALTYGFALRPSRRLAILKYLQSVICKGVK